MTAALSIHTLSQSVAVDWSYSGRPYRLRRTLAQKHAPVDLDGKVSIRAYSCPKVPKLGGLLVYLAGFLSKEGDPVRTFRDQANGFRFGLRDCQSERSAYSNDNCRHLRKTVPRSQNDARGLCIKYSPDRFRPLHGLGRDECLTFDLR